MESKPALHHTGARRLTSAKPTALSGQALVLRIELRDSNPLVYRTILVPATITLPKLHVTLLPAMGWQGGHLHEFIVDDTHYGELDPDYPEPDLKNQQRVRLTKALGYVKKTDQETSVLFELIAHRCERGSLIITSSQAFNDWDRLFDGSVMTVAAIDRLVHHGTIMALEGESYRRKTSLQRKKTE